MTIENKIESTEKQLNSIFGFFFLTSFISLWISVISQIFFSSPLISKIFLILFLVSFVIALLIGIFSKENNSIQTPINVKSSDYIMDPAYSHMPGNINHHTYLARHDNATFSSPTMSHIPENIHHNPFNNL